jgi:hypothetical protein
MLERTTGSNHLDQLLPADNIGIAKIKMKSKPAVRIYLSRTRQQSLISLGHSPGGVAMLAISIHRPSHNHVC